MTKNFEKQIYESGLIANGCWDELDEYTKECIQIFGEMIVEECAQHFAHSDKCPPGENVYHCTGNWIAKEIRNQVFENENETKRNVTKEEHEILMEAVMASSKYVPQKVKNEWVSLTPKERYTIADGSNNNPYRAVELAEVLLTAKNL